MDKSKAKVNKICSDHDKNFVYEVGKQIKVKDFNNDVRIECSNGIHFFITFKEALNY